MGNLGKRDPAGECFKPVMENSLRRVGILYQDLEHPRPVRDFGHLVDFHARVELLNISLKIRFSALSHERFDLADKNSLRGEEIRERERGEVNCDQGKDGSGC